MVFLVIQAALVYHARSIVAAAAEDAARAAQVEDGSAADGRAVAGAVLERVGRTDPDPGRHGGAERDRRVASPSAAPVRGPIPWLHPTVSASAGGPVERFVPESQR